MIAIIGLGNPGKTYEKTVHNLGYMAIDYFARAHQLVFGKSKYYGRVAEGLVQGEKVILLKPETYMNLSGKSVLDLVNSLKLDVRQIIVLVDDIDLAMYDVRIRAKGSGGTHNGLKDIVAKIGQDFARIRIGAGKNEVMDLANYVTSNIPKDNLKGYEPIFEKISKILERFVETKSIEGVDVNNF